MNTPLSGFSTASEGRVVRGIELDELAASLAALSFWVAVALPLVYLPLLAAGVPTAGGLQLFFGLFGLHVLALVGGRGHAHADGAGQHARVR